MDLLYSNDCLSFPQWLPAQVKSEKNEAWLEINKRPLTINN